MSIRQTLSNDVLGELSKEQIRLAAAPHVIPSSSMRLRSSVCAYIRTTPPDVQQRILDACMHARESRTAAKRKSTTKRQGKWRKKRKYATGQNILNEMDSGADPRAEDTASAIAENHNIAECSGNGDASQLVRDVNKFLDLPSPKELQDCHRRFLRATSNESLAQAVCASCARLLMEKEMKKTNYSNLDNRDLLRPWKSHKAHKLTDGLLLDCDHLDFSTGNACGWICDHCSLALSNKKRPAYSLGNNMWIGPVPQALSMLTIPEQLLIALIYPRAYIFKLYPRGTRSDHPDALQTALKGNVTTYHANAQAVVKMLEGQLMPRTTAILPSLVAVTFVGHQKLSTSQLKSLFTVRWGVIYEALKELKYLTEHPGYVNLEISEERLNMLPEDGVPEEITLTLRAELDEAVVEKESDSYLPPETETAQNSDNLADNKSDDANGTVPLVEDEPEDDEPDIIPLEYAGTSAADETQITPKELMRQALQSYQEELSQQMTYEGAYAVRHGGFARDFGQPELADNTNSLDENPSAWTFPWLFPYGIGGLEAKRPVSVSFVNHTRVLLQSNDRRFRMDRVFPFWCMSLEQKRQALHGARLLMSRKDFDRSSDVLSQLTEEDLTKAAKDEELGKVSTDPKVALLRRCVQATMQKVMGSNAARALNRSKIWSTSLYLNPANLWITLNFIDRHDPICQVFAGENIDMDNFRATVGPSAHQRACNVAKDPFAATQFFFFLARTVLETLFGFAPRGCTTSGHRGALGDGSAYFGVVEAQGRGSLHLHMLMWVQNSPNAAEMGVKLQSEAFREKIKKFVQANIRSHLDDLTETVLQTMEPCQELAWGRPPNPDSETYEEDLRLLEIRLAHSQQQHTCSSNTCLVWNKKTNKKVCKRHAPFPLSPDDVVQSNGVILTKRTVGRINAWCPTSFFGGRCNNDIKLFSNGGDARGLTWYITNYATKKQGYSFNQSAIFAKTYMFHQTHSEELKDARERNRALVFRCGHSLNKEMEYSGQQVMAYLMGWGDTILSHTYSPIFWSSVVRKLKSIYPELAISEANGNTGQQKEGNEDQTNATKDEVALPLAVSQSGTTYLRCQLDDYSYRGPELEQLSFLDYFVNTYEERIKTRSEYPSASADGQRPDPSEEKQHPGRPRHLRAPYLPPHPRADTWQRVVRSTGHRNLPDILGPWIERSDCPETYPLHCASALALLKPWRVLEDLKPQQASWETTLDSFLASADDKQRCIYSNIQYYYQCRDSADATQQLEADTIEARDPEPDVVNPDELSEFVNGIEIEKVVLSWQQERELEHAEEAVGIGQQLGLFGATNQSLDASTSNQQVIITTNDAQLDEINLWSNELKQCASDIQSRHPPVPPAPSNDLGDIGSLAKPDSLNPNEPTVTYEGSDPVQKGTEIDLSDFSDDQKRAFLIIRNHASDTYSGKSRDQLLMQIQGEGGTGKSHVIAAVTNHFKLLGQESGLRRAAYTGIAASQVEGSTLHQLALLHLASRNLSQKSRLRLQITWSEVRYLIIDEVSMISKRNLAVISEMIGKAKQPEDENNSTVPFGGINVIIAGDFHQFPPVVGSGSGKGALYAPADSDRLLKSKLGSDLYAQFLKVVLLKKQFRNQDEVWQGVLHRSRYGECTDNDLSILRSLVLNPNRDRTLFSAPDSPWQTAVLVTPRNAVRNRWNELTSRNHCRQTGHTLVQSHAYDTYQNQELSHTLRVLVDAKSPDKKKGSSKSDPGGLPDVVQLAYGMEVMITFNIETELDLANGARGKVERIYVHPGSIAMGPPSSPDIPRVLELIRPPACVLVRLNKTKVKGLTGLDDGIIPVLPIRNQFKVETPSSQELTVWREQIPLTPAYAFTDYRSQGQTLPYVIVDLGTPPSGGITPFNAYVALSRSVSRDRVRLLRDFNPKLFQTPPSKDLAAEDKRLEDLNINTKQEFDEGKL